jgi:hypothetical protein
MWAIMSDRQITEPKLQKLKLLPELQKKRSTSLTVGLQCGWSLKAFTIHGQNVNVYERI